ncbi:hypothetical protein DV737_g2658, partial [Chaetothyriales sp. CBS 132003]
MNSSAGKPSAGARYNMPAFGTSGPQQPSAGLIFDKSNPGVRRATPDSEALASSDDEGDNSKNQAASNPKVSKPTRRTSWLNDVSATSITRKPSVTSPYSPSASNPGTPGVDQPAWSGIANTSAPAWNPSGSSITWGGIWGLDSGLGKVREDDDEEGSESHEGADHYDASQAQRAQRLEQENAQLRYALQSRDRTLSAHSTNPPRNHRIPTGVPEEYDNAVDDQEDMSGSGLLQHRGNNNMRRMSEQAGLAYDKQQSPSTFDSSRKALWQTSLGFGPIQEAPQSDGGVSTYANGPQESVPGEDSGYFATSASTREAADTHVHSSYLTSQPYSPHSHLGTYLGPANNTGLQVGIGDLVIVEADRGTDLGTVQHINVTWDEARRYKEHYAEEHYKWLMMFSQQSRNGGPNVINPNGLPGRPGSSVGGLGGQPVGHHGAHEATHSELKPKMIKRLAQAHEIKTLQDKEGNEAKAKRACQQKVVEHRLNMEILDAEFQMDSKKLTFYYFADSYINFNPLVTDLFKIYKTRIWMSAINPASFQTPTASLGLQPVYSGVPSERDSPAARGRRQQYGQPQQSPITFESQYDNERSYQEQQHPGMRNPFIGQLGFPSGLTQFGGNKIKRGYRKAAKVYENKEETPPKKRRDAFTITKGTGTGTQENENETTETLESNDKTRFELQLLGLFEAALCPIDDDEAESVVDGGPDDDPVLHVPYVRIQKQAFAANLNGLLSDCHALTMTYHSLITTTAAADGRVPSVVASLESDLDKDRAAIKSSIMAVASAFTAAGYAAVIASRHPNVDELRRQKFAAVVCDVTSPPSVAQAFQDVTRDFGTPDVVVYNAAAATFPTAPDDPFSVEVSAYVGDVSVNLVVTLGSGKAGLVYLIEVANKAYQQKGWKFYFVSQVTQDGSPVPYDDLDGASHVRQSEGGQTTVYNTPAPFHDIKPDSVLFQQLQNIYANIPKDQPFQDNVQIKDEMSFFEYMRSSASSAAVPVPEQDLGHPMSSYYISSSHNTYLSGNQLYGSASTDAYTNVLRSGCRCLEIDVWDGEESGTSAGSSDDEPSVRTGRSRSESKPSRWSRMKAKAANIRGSSPKPAHQTTNPQPTESDSSRLSASDTYHNLDGEPVVLHGFTLTQSVPFRAVCHAIEDSAFITSDLPIIVSLEVHASLDQQQKMVDIMKDVWKDHLVGLTSLEERNLDALPSPSSLKNKILIKVKGTHNSQTGESSEPPQHVTSTATQSATGEAITGATSSSQKKNSKILAALSELGVYTKAFTFKHWDQPEASMPTHVFSLSEGKMLEMHSDPTSGPALFKHNKRFLMRVFPRGTRIRSSNVDPSFHWRMGAQMVALNWQKLDKGMMLNEGMFAGSQGWILKPEGYRAKDQVHPATGDEITSKIGLLDLEIQLLSAQDLPLPQDKDDYYRARMKPYVQIQLHVDTHGPPGQGKSNHHLSRDDSDAYGDEDAEDKKYQRRSKTARTDSPSFEGEVLSWAGVADGTDELSFVR